jgi:hypothetical protein
MLAFGKHVDRTMREAMGKGLCCFGSVAVICEFPFACTVLQINHEDS